MRTLNSMLTAFADIVRLDLTFDLSDLRFDVDAEAVTADLMLNQS
jgi:hypothetical protein